MEDTHYLDHACLGKPSPRTVAAVKKEIDSIASTELPATEHTIRLFQAVDCAREEISRFIHVAPETVLLVENTTHGLGLIASSLSLASGDNILVADLEFLSATVVWRGVSQRRGIEIRKVNSSGGRIHPEDFAKAADDRTRVLVISSVQEVTGFRADLEAFCDLATSLKAFLIVDGIQEVGAVPVDLSRTPVDAYTSGGHKWLRSPFGAGFLHVHPRLLENMQPPFFGYLALKEPPNGWEHYLRSEERGAFDALPVLSDARRLWNTGTPNWFGAIALKNAIQELSDVGPQKIWEHISRLREELLKGLYDLDVVLPTMSPAWRHSGIVSCGLRKGPDAEANLMTALRDCGVYVSLRRAAGCGGIRISIHYDNTREDIVALLDVVRQCSVIS